MSAMRNKGDLVLVQDNVDNGALTSEHDNDEIVYYSPSS